MKKLNSLSIYQLKLQIRDLQAMFFLIIFPVIMYLISNSFLKDMIGYNSNFYATDYLVPAYIPITIINSGVMIFGFTLTLYKEKKYFIKYKLLGFRPIQIAISVSITTIICQLIGILSLVLFAYFVNNIAIPFNNMINVILAILIITVFQFSIGYFLSSIFKKTSVYQTVALIVFYIQMFFGGMTIPPEMFGKAMLKIVKIINPIIHGLYMMRGVWLEKKSILDFPRACIILVGGSIVLVVVASIIEKTNYQKKAY